MSSETEGKENTPVLSPGLAHTAELGEGWAEALRCGPAPPLPTLIPTSYYTTGPVLPQPSYPPAPYTTRPPASAGGSPLQAMLDLRLLCTLRCVCRACCATRLQSP